MNQSWQRQKEAARNNPVMQMNATARVLERLEKAFQKVIDNEAHNNKTSP